MLYSKNGSIPKPRMDDTYGWIGVPDKPTAPEGKEVVWWYPPGWVIRDPKPADEEGYKWSWSQSTEEWVKYALSNDTSDQVDSPALEQSEVLVIVDTPAPSTAGSEPPASE
jgi:hypothetical protein